MNNPKPISKESDSQPVPAKQESLLLNLLCNIALPTLILTKLSGEQFLELSWRL